MWRLEEIKDIHDDPVNGDWLSGLFKFNPANKLEPNIICGKICGSEAQKMKQKSDADVEAVGVKRLINLSYDIFYILF